MTHVTQRLLEERYDRIISIVGTHRAAKPVEPGIMISSGRDSYKECAEAFILSQHAPRGGFSLLQM
jgi:hypothetical protein